MSRRLRDRRAATLAGVLPDGAHVRRNAASTQWHFIGLGLLAVALIALAQRGPVAALPQTAAFERAETPAPAAIADATERDALNAYGKLPLAFVPNAGQTDARVRFSARAGGASFWFTPREAVFSFAGEREGHVLRLQFLGANQAPAIEGVRRAPGKVNYLHGNDPSRWRTGLPTYESIVYRELWPGIDLAFSGTNGTLKYEFRLAPGANVRDIRLAYRGAKRLSLGKAGELRLHTRHGVLRDTAPVSYQAIDGRRAPVASRFVLDGSGYGFALGGGYDPRRPLVIDPGLVYSTYLGGTGVDLAFGIALDSTGNAYVTGQTGSLDFPTTPGAFDTTFNGGDVDAFVTKLNAAGSALVYSTYVGGGNREAGSAIALDPAGNAYVTGSTLSADFPTTPGAFNTTANGHVDAFVTKLNAAGSALVYSTYLGGTSQDEALSVALDSVGSAYVTGRLLSADFPTTPGAFDTTFNGVPGRFDAFVTKLNATGSALVYSTYLGAAEDEWGNGIGLDSAGNAYVTGVTTSAGFPTTLGAFDTTYNGVTSDAFVTKLNAIGSALVYSTFLGGTTGDQAWGIALDSAGIASVAGQTSSADFPTTPGAYDTTFSGNVDAFVTKLDAAGSALVYSTYLGGTDGQAAFGIALDAAGNAYVTGLTFSADFPTTPGAFDTTFNGGDDAFVTELNAAGSALVYSTYLGGGDREQGTGIAVDSAGSVYVTGWTMSADFPTTPGAYDTTFNGGFNDAFVTKLNVTGAPATLVLTPAAATNPVGTMHTVTVTVTDAAGKPVPAAVVRFTVTGAHTLSGSCTTGPNGQCTFSYTGTQAGTDAITAYADSNNDNVQDLGEPTGAATKVWTAPTPGCPPNGGDDDEDDDGLEDDDENLLGTLLGNFDSDGDGHKDGNDDANENGTDDEDEDDGTEDECPNDSDGDGEDDEDEDDEDDEDEDDDDDDDDDDDEDDDDD